MNNMVYLNQNPNKFLNIENLIATNTCDSRLMNDTSSLGPEFFANDGNFPHATIDEESLVKNIMTVYLDHANRAILASLTKPLTIREIIKVCKIPQSSAYRRITFLQKNGYIRICGYKKEFGKNTKSAKFEKTIQNITIHINDNTNLIMLNAKKELFQKIKLNHMMK